MTASTGATIGKAAVGILQKPDETANRFVKVHSVDFTQQTLLVALEKATASKWEVENVSTAEVIEHKRALLEQDNFMAAFLDVLGQQLFEAGAGRGAHVGAGDSDNELLGITVDDLDSTVSTIVKGS